MDYIRMGLLRLLEFLTCFNDIHRDLMGYSWDLVGYITIQHFIIIVAGLHNHFLRKTWYNMTLYSVGLPSQLLGVRKTSFTLTYFLRPPAQISTKCRFRLWNSARAWVRKPWLFRAAKPTSKAHGMPCFRLVNASGSDRFGISHLGLGERSHK